MRTLFGFSWVGVFVIGLLSAFNIISNRAAPPLSMDDQAGYVFRTANGEVVGFVERTGQFLIRSGAAEVNDDLWKSYAAEDSQDVRSFRAGWAPVQIDGKWGFINDNCKVKIKPIYDATHGFNEDFAWVKLDNGWTFIKDNGKPQTKERFEDAWGFRSGYAQIKKGGKWGFMNRDGKISTQPTFDDVGYYEDGIAPVKSGGLWGF